MTRGGNLVLSRFEGEAITIVCPNGDTIQVKVADIRTPPAGMTGQKKVRIAIDAGKEYRIWRNELVAE